MPAAGVVTIVAVLLIVVALLVYLIPTILTLRQITSGLDEAIAGVGGLIEKTEPVNGVVQTINGQLDAAVDALEGLLVKKAGVSDAMGLLEGLYPGAAAEGLRNFPDSGTTPAPRISEVYTKGTLTLARLGREAPVAAVSPEGPVLRDVAYGSLNARLLYPNTRQSRPGILPKSPVIGTDSPVQYEASDTPGVRQRMPARAAAPAPAGAPGVASPPEAPPSQATPPAQATTTTGPESEPERSA